MLLPLWCATWRPLEQFAHEVVPGRCCRCSDCCSPGHDFLFLFDQSSGHTKMRKDGLTTSNMNVSWGGAVPEMQSTVAKELGEFEATLNVGDIQSMIFTEEDDGPFWMTERQRLEQKTDRLTGNVKNREKTKIEMLSELRRAGVDTTKKRFLKEELVELCEKNNIAVKRTNTS